MKLDVLNIKGEKTGKTVELPADIFGIEPNEHAVYLAVKQYLAHQRQGTHKSKERSELSGSTRKLHKQKGTGGSRKGDIKSPVFHGGARVFGPKPHDYDIKLNKKVRQLARKSAFSSKAASGKIVIVEDMNMDAPKTKTFISAMSSFVEAGRKAILVLPEQNDMIFKSSRNVRWANVSRASDLNTYEIMNCKSLVLTESSIAKIQETFA